MHAHHVKLKFLLITCYFDLFICAQQRDGRLLSEEGAQGQKLDLSPGVPSTEDLFVGTFLK